MRAVDDDVFEFLWESNKIEKEYSIEALSNAVDAWHFFTEVNKYMFSYPSFLHTHYLLMRNIDVKIAGEVRDCDVFIGGMKCQFISKALLQSELEVIAGRINRSIKEERKMEDDEFMARKLHVDFERVHPFADGNGRTGRIIMNAHRLKMGLPIHTIHACNDDKNYYITDEQADYYSWFREI